MINVTEDPLGCCLTNSGQLNPVDPGRVVHINTKRFERFATFPLDWFGFVKVQPQILTAKKQREEYAVGEQNDTIAVWLVFC